MKGFAVTMNRSSVMEFDMTKAMDPQYFSSKITSNVHGHNNSNQK
jgi:hypothetical protein